MAMAGRMMQAESARFGRHGGRLDAAARAYPAAPAPWLDLSTGINPEPWTPPADLAVDAGPLPGVEALAGLEASAASFFGAAPAQVAAVPGSELALRLLPLLGLPAPTVAAAPSYGTHGEVAAARIDRGLLMEAPGRGGTLLLANPNNPDGDAIDSADLRVLAERQAAAGGWLVVDEAFGDVAPGMSLAPLVSAEARLIVLRSFGKFFGLAGVRLGFVIAPAAILKRLRAVLGDWPVSAQAIGWGAAAYADGAWIERTRATLAQRAAQLDAVLGRHGLVARGACPLFRLVVDPEAAALFERLASTGILTRPFADQADWLRFGLPGDDDAFDRLERALARG